MRKKLISIVLASAISFFSTQMVGNTATLNEPDYSLWDKFIKYDLCITDYDTLTDEEKELCRFIFETEQSSGDTIICERARRTLAHGENIGERITLEQLDGAYGIWDNYSVYKNGWQTYIHCVPDIIHLDNLYYGYTDNEYWLDDAGNTYVKFNEKYTADDIKSFDIYDCDDNVIKNIRADEMESPYKDFRCDIEYMEKNGFIEKNGGYYYIKSDNTAVFAWSVYSASDSSEPVEEPFVVESEINGCPVVAIERGAFSDAPLTEIILPDSIEFIDRMAFSMCSNLNKINFPEKLKCISDLVFLGCDSLNKVYIDCPELNILNNAFSSCTGLKSASLNVKEIGEFAFASCSELESVTLGESVTKISANAFKNCKNLSNIDISEGINAIGQGAFLNGNIKSITIPSTVEVIGALPRNEPTEYLSIGVVETHPLTDEPVCVFDSDCVINGLYDTEAHFYALEWGLKFNPMDELLYGDTNLDESINVADAVVLQDHLLRGDPVGYEADLNKDGRIDVFDMISMRNFLIDD